MIGPGDADVLVSLQPGHAPTQQYVRQLRARLPREFPGTLFYFLSADIVSQTLNFNLPAPFDVQIVSHDQVRNRALAVRLAEAIKKIPGAVDVRVQQPDNLPQFSVEVDRVKAAELGLTEQDVARSVLLGLSGSSQVQPASPPVVSHYNVRPVIEIYGGVDGRDLGGVLRDLQPLVEKIKPELPRGSTMVLRGQTETMRSSYLGLGGGLLMAIVLIYFLLVVNFQSWKDLFIIITALPGALAGVVWGLFLTQTTLSVPALMGAIMSLGVAAANRLNSAAPKPSVPRGASPAGRLTIHTQNGRTNIGSAAWRASGDSPRGPLAPPAALRGGMKMMKIGSGCDQGEHQTGMPPSNDLTAPPKIISALAPAPKNESNWRRCT